MKLKMRFKLKSFKKKIVSCWYKFWEVVVFKPMSKPYLAIQDRKNAKKRDGANYNPNKIKRLLRKTLQDILLVDNCIYIFDIKYISELDKFGDFLELRDVFRNSTHKYLEDYWCYAKNPIIPKADFWDIIVGFDGDEMDVKDISKEEFLKDMSEWKYTKRSALYRESKRIIRVKVKED